MVDGGLMMRLRCPSNLLCPAAHASSIDPDSAQKITRMKLLIAIVALSATASFTQGLQQPLSPPSSRRALLSQVPAVAATMVVATAISLPEPTWAAGSVGPPPDLEFVEVPSGLQYADAKLGSGDPIVSKGSTITIDYVMSTTGARYGSKIYATADTNNPYRFQLGDGSTIPGLETAIAGGDGVEPMKPGGIRRVIIPSKLAYASLAQPLGGSGLQYENCQEGKGGVGPIPPTGEGNVSEYYQRFKNIYCNANRPYQPDLVMDVKLYGKR